VIRQAGLTVVHWDVVGEDGFNLNTQEIVTNVVHNTQNGSIIVLHMNGAPTAPKTGDALPEIISQLQAKGFTFVKVSEML
jgi:peptidoglycan/xylan/chitin deacetylase (PgdA/CDA1 family)